MAWTFRIAVSRLLFVFSLLCCTSSEFIQTLVGQNLSLVSRGRCLKSTKGSVVQVPPHGSSRDVARIVDGVWTPRPDFEGRFSPGGAVEFKDAAFSDNGVYELTCSSLPKTVIIQVEVLVPFQVRASVGQSVRLPCHFLTAGVKVESVRWDRDSDLVLQKDLKLRETLSGDGFGGRAEVSEEVQRRGDLTLSLQSVRVQDRGPFFCRVRVSGQDWTSGDPAAVQLWVNPNISSAPGHGSGNTESLHVWLSTGIIVLFMLSVSLSVFLLMIYCRTQEERRALRVQELTEHVQGPHTRLALNAPWTACDGEPSYNI